MTNIPPVSPIDTSRITERTLLLTTKEVAAICRVDPRTVERWALDGRLRRFDLGPRTVRYRTDDVAALIGRDTEQGHATH
jgi:excisionase family DNA binding protein